MTSHRVTKSVSISSLPPLSLRFGSSLRTSPRRGSDNPTPIERQSTSRLRLNEVLDRCHTLRHDLTSTYNSLRSGQPGPLLTFAQFRHEVDSPMRGRWKSSPKYLEVKQRILMKEQEAKEMALDSQVTHLQTIFGNRKHQRDVKLIIRKTRLDIGRRKAREVEEPVHISSQMLGAFLIAQKMAKEPRNFGENFSSSKNDEMGEFWKAEIEKYEKQRNDRILGPTAKPQPDPAHESQTKDTKPDTGLSPLQLYVHSYNSRKIFGEEQGSIRKRRIEQKMEGIQPSSEVIALAQKYLPKNLRKIRRKAGSYGGSEKLFSTESTTEPHREQLSLKEKPYEEGENDFLKGEIQKELRDTGKLLSLEAILAGKKRMKTIKMKKQSL